MKKKSIVKPSHVLTCIAMINPKNAPTKCKAKYNAPNSSFIISFYHSYRLKNTGVSFRRFEFYFLSSKIEILYLRKLLSYIILLTIDVKAWYTFIFKQLTERE